MRKTFLFITAILLFAGCAKEHLVDERSYSGPVTVVSATFESLGDDATKAAVTDAGVFTWQKGDTGAFTASSGSVYCTGTNDKDGATANFTINGDIKFTSNSFAFYPSDLTTGQSSSSDNVTVPATRVWKESQTNVAMYGAKLDSAKFSFTHMGGLVRVKINNVPTNARKFVFKTPGYKINGEFSVGDESSYKVIQTASSTDEDEQTYTLTWETDLAPENTMYFYIPLPLGTYTNGFAFKLLDADDAELISKTASQSQEIKRKDLVLMPAITLAGGVIEPGVKPAVVANIPAGHSGDFYLPQSENVLLKIDATGTNNINLKYTGGNVPTNLKIQVEGDTLRANLSGNLPDTHVEFTQGHINQTELTTSSSTFAVINPATVKTLVVRGGNVVIKGTDVDKIVVDANAVADGETKAPVQIVMEKYENVGPTVKEGIVAAANVIVAPKEEGIQVTVKPENNATVATEGAGTVKDESGTEIKTKAAAKIGDVHYITLADAIAAVKDDQTIELLCNVTDAKGITVAEGKKFTVDFGGYTYTCASDPAGSTNTKNQVFQLLQNSTITFKNGTINVAESAKTQFRFIIQNYANLTLMDMTLDGTNLAVNTGKVNYTISNNNGTVVFAGKTNIKAAELNGIAFDVYDKKEYDGVPTVTVNTTGTIEGQVEVTGGTLVVMAGTFITKGARRTTTANHQSPTLLVTSGTVTVKEGSFTSEHDVAVRAEGGTVTLTKGTFTGVEGAVCFPGTGATINIDDGTYTASDNAVLIGQGSNRTGESNTVNVSGGKFIGGISSQGYIACGIYSAWNDKITVTGGEFTITNGAGVVARAGIVTIDGGVFNCIGTATGKVGDKNVQIPCEPLYYDDSEPDYPGRDKATSKIIATGGSFSKEPAAKYIDPAYTVKKDGEYYKVVELPDGALKGVFSVSADKKVHFSKGNLTYNVPTTTWGFYEHQYDCATDTVYNANLISLFTWGYNENTSTDPDGEEYVTGHTKNGESFSASEDWGSQIGDGKTWRTLTTDEWQYLFNTRATSTNTGTDNARYAKATVNSISGIILLPDKYEHPSGVAELKKLNPKNDSENDIYTEAAFTENTYSVADWEKMEAAGAVFLPSAGYRDGSSVEFDNNYGAYWSSTACDEENAYYVDFASPLYHEFQTNLYN